MDARPGRKAGGVTVSVTEQEIREAIERRLREPTGYIDTDAELTDALRRIAVEAARPIVESGAQTLEGGQGVWEPVDDPADGVLWADLRPSEAVALSGLVRRATDRAAQRCEEVVVEELTRAALRFAEEHPDAPRPAPAAA